VIFPLFFKEWRPSVRVLLSLKARTVSFFAQPLLTGHENGTTIFDIHGLRLVPKKYTPFGKRPVTLTQHRPGCKTHNRAVREKPTVPPLRHHQR